MRAQRFAMFLNFYLTTYNDFALDAGRAVVGVSISLVIVGMLTLFQYFLCTMSILFSNILRFLFMFCDYTFKINVNKVNVDGEDDGVQRQAGGM